jgi:histidinol-phosphate/aromatic aminotransferase/cobyric acid decarboxylase-like protein
MNIAKYIKPEVLRLKGYHLDKREYSIKLDQNENPFGFPEARENSGNGSNPDWARYPDFQMDLTAKIVTHASCR